MAERLTLADPLVLLLDMNEPIPVCWNCNRPIWRHVYGGAVIWRHFSGFMLCQPDDTAPDFDGVRAAEPTPDG